MAAQIPPPYTLIRHLDATTPSNLRIATTIFVKPVSRLIYRLGILFKGEIQKSE